MGVRVCNFCDCRLEYINIFVFTHYSRIILVTNANTVATQVDTIRILQVNSKYNVG